MEKEEDLQTERINIVQLKASSLESLFHLKGLVGSEDSVGPDGQLVQMVRKAQIVQCQDYLS